MSCLSGIFVSETTVPVIIALSNKINPITPSTFAVFEGSKFFVLIIVYNQI